MSLLDGNIILFIVVLVPSEPEDFLPLEIINSGDIHPDEMTDDLFMI
jgi:hypothetical protein